MSSRGEKRMTWLYGNRDDEGTDDVAVAAGAAVAACVVGWDAAAVGSAGAVATATPEASPFTLTSWPKTQPRPPGAAGKLICHHVPSALLPRTGALNPLSNVPTLS